MAKSIIRVKNVSKYFGEVKALDNLSLEIEPGVIYGLLGPNGAGKTTLVRLLSTLITPTSGEIEVAGLNVVREANEVRKIIGLAGQYAAVDEFLTGRETLEMVGSLYHLPKKQVRERAAELLYQLSLTDAADRPAKTYSGGMRRRLDLAASLVTRPKVMFLDEPTAGLDPRTRRELWEVIRELARDGSTVLLTTQYLDEADALTGYITLIDRGRIAAEGTPSELKRTLGAELIEISFPMSARAAGRRVLEEINAKELIEDEITGTFRLPASEGSQTLLHVAQALEKAQVKPDEISLHRPSLDDVFLAVTGQGEYSQKET
jgi:ABC-2 type transport system ATP-binding protein